MGIWCTRPPGATVASMEPSHLRLLVAPAEELYLPAADRLHDAQPAVKESLTPAPRRVRQRELVVASLLRCPDAGRRDGRAAA